MIAIKLTDTGQWLDLPLDISLRYEMLFPAFDMEAMQANVVYPFEFPIMGNEEKMNHANVIQVNRTTRKYNVAFYVHGVMMFVGEMYVKSFGNSMFSASIIEKNILAGFTETDINDVGWEDIAIENLWAYANAAVSQSWPDTPVNFPTIKAQNCYGENNAGNTNFDGYINNYDRTAGYFVPNIMDVDETEPDNKNCLLPLVYLFEVLAQIERNFKLSIDGTFTQNEDYKRLLLTSLRLADAGSLRYYCKILENAPPAAIYHPSPTRVMSIYRERTLWLFEDTDTENCWDEYTYEIKHKGYHNIKGTITVDWDVWNPGEDHCHFYLMMTPNNVVDYYVDYDEQGHTVIEYDHTFFAFAADVGKFLFFMLDITRGTTSYSPDSVVISLEISNSSTSMWNVGDNPLNVGKYLPAMKVAAFINNIRSTFGLSMFFDNSTRQIELSDYNSILDSNSIDLTNFISVKDFDLEILDETKHNLIWNWGSEERTDADTSAFASISDIISRNSLPHTSAFGSIIQVLYEKNFLQHFYDAGVPSWRVIEDAFNDYIESDTASEIKPDVAPIRMIYDSATILPVITVSPLSLLYASGNESSSLRLLSYFGMVNDSNSLAFPFASSGRFDIYGSQLGNIDLDWNGDAGLYENCFDRWFKFLENQESLTQQLRVGLNEFTQIKNLFMPQVASKKTRKIRLANIDYVPEKVSVIFTNAETWECEAILRKKGTVTL